MNVDEYERKCEPVYAELAEIVRSILAKAIHEMGDNPQPQAIQYRQKTPTKLKLKLQKRGLLESQTIEKEVKDLAGVRLIFYTNTDLDRFLNSRLILENFEVYWDETRIHHPTSENSDRYQAIHYMVSLGSVRESLSEYLKFKGMRCEIQIQTVLNHAWAETSHDILYKNSRVEGFGSKSFRSIENRMKRIMDKYLLPAGYELEKVQHDFERFKEGKPLFDRGTLESLAECADNNERHDTLSKIREYVIPNFDDIQGIYPELSRALVEAVQAARESPPKLVETPFGNLNGKTAQDVSSIVVDILNDLRYVDIERMFRALVEIYRGEQDIKTQNHIIQAVERLAHYDLRIWKQAGSEVQIVLATIVENLSTEDRGFLQPLVISVWSQLLKPEMKSTSVSVDAVTIGSSVIPVTEDIVHIRKKAIDGLFAMYDQSQSDAEKGQIFFALIEAMRLPIRGYSNELCAEVLGNTNMIVQLFTQRANTFQYDLLEHVEDEFLFQYRRARGILVDEQDRFGCKEIAENLIRSILAFRDQVNTDDQYIRYKTLVGFESVFPHHWVNDEFDYEKVIKYRKQEAMKYIEAISEASEGEWYLFIERCAATRSNDMATFQIFGEFLYDLAKAKPAIAIRFLERANSDVLDFLPSFLNGLFNSHATQEYQEMIGRLLREGKYLSALASHFRKTGSVSLDSIKELLSKAIAACDDIAAIECLILATEKGEPNEYLLKEDVFFPAIKYLITRNDARWIHGIGYLPQSKVFFESLSAKESDLILESMIPIQKIDHDSEKILTYIAEKNPESVWRFFEKRIFGDHIEGKNYQPFPYQFHELQEPLSRNVGLAVKIVRGWFQAEGNAFQYTGGRLLNIVFPTFPESFAQKLSHLIGPGSQDDLRFTLSILQNYHGKNVIHGLLKQMVERLSDDDPLLTNVEICILSTGVVVGEFGWVEAFEERSAEITPWLDDISTNVKTFVLKCIHRLEERIKFEQRSAEQRKALRKLEFESEG